MPEANDNQQMRNTFTPEMRLLMALVGRTLGYSDMPLPHLTPAEWERFPETAAAHRVQPLAYEALKTCSEAVPIEIMARMKGGAERRWIHATMLAQELGRVSRVLADHEIPMAALKGPALAAQAYGSGTARTMHDLDILICPSDFPRTLTVLEASGFLWEDPVRRLAPAAQEFYRQSATHLNFRHVRLGYLLEVHIRALLIPALLPIPVEELIAEAQLVCLAGMPVPTLSPWHHFLFVAAHGAKHGWWRLHWLADFAAFLQHYPEWFSRLGSEGSPAPESQTRWEMAGALGLSRVLHAAFRLSCLCFGTPLPDHACGGGSETAAVRAIVQHGVQSLARGRPPVTFWETQGWFLQFLRLRADPAYFSQVLSCYLQITQEDLLRFPLPAKLMILYPALRPWLWLIRKFAPGK